MPESEGAAAGTASELRRKCPGGQSGRCIPPRARRSGRNSAAPGAKAQGSTCLPKARKFTLLPWLGALLLVLGLLPRAMSPALFILRFYFAEMLSCWAQTCHTPASVPQNAGVPAEGSHSGHHPNCVVPLVGAPRFAHLRDVGGVTCPVISLRDASCGQRRLAEGVLYVGHSVAGLG